MPEHIRDYQLYDEAYGPRNPRSYRARQRAINGVWDDPTWLQVCVDEAYMAEEDRGARRYGWRPPRAEPGEWLSFKEAAALIGSSDQALYQRRRHGRLPFTVQYRSGLKIHRSQVEAYLKGEPLPFVPEYGDLRAGEGHVVDDVVPDEE